MFDIQVSGDVKGVSKMDSRLLLAAGRAIDDTGKFAQSEVIRELDDEFVLRGSWYKPKTRYGINFIATQSGNLTGLLYTRADWLLEEEGYNRGVKTPESGDHLSDPEDPVTRGPITRKFPRGQKAGNLLLNAQGAFSNIRSRKRGARGAGHFLITPKGKPDLQYLFQRVRLSGGQIRRNKKGIPIRGRVTGRGGTALVLKHILKKSVKVDRPMVIQKTTRNVYRVWYGEYFGRNILRALNTAK